MKSNGQSLASGGRPRAQEPSSRGLLLVLLLFLLVLGASTGGALWWLKRDKGQKPGNPSLVGPISTNGGGTETDKRPPCSDDDDPKYLEQLEFGPPLVVRFDPRPLAGLKKTPLPAIEVYPWQPAGLVAILGEHRMRGQLVAVRPDKKTLAVATSGVPWIRLGSVETLHEKHQLICPGGVLKLAWSPVGNRLAVSSHAGGVLLFDMSNLEKVPPPVALEKPAPVVTSLSWSGDGKYLIGGDSTPGQGIAYVWDVGTRKIIQRLKHEGAVSSVAFSPVPGDYRALTSGWTQDGSLYLWNAVKSDKEVAVIDFRPAKTDTTVYVGEVSFSPDGKRALSCHPDQRVRIWNLDNFKKGAEHKILPGHAPLPLAAFSPDGNSVVTYGLGGATVWLWDVAQGKQVRQLAATAGVHSLRFLDAERILWSGNVSNDANIHINEVKTGKELLPPHGHLNGVTSVALSHDGKTIASGSYDLTVRLWGLTPGSGEATTAKERSKISAGHVWGVGFHPDGKRLYHHGGSFGHLVLVDAQSGKVVSPAWDKHAGGIVSADVTRDGRYAVTGGQDGHVRMWRLSDGKQVREFAHDGQPRIWIAPDMRRAIRTGGTKTRLLHLRCQTTLREWDPVIAAPFLPDGRAVFLGGAKAPSWKITAEKVQEADAFPVNLTGASAVSLAADGKNVAALVPGRVAVLEMSSGKQRWSWTPPPHFSGVHAVSLSPDGTHLLTANGDGTVYVVRLP
jgi:WD40 repeat protein